MSLSDVWRFATLTDELGRARSWPKERVERKSKERLRAIVRWAAARSPFYGRRYRRLETEDLRLDLLPPVTKEEIRDSLDDVFTDRRVTRSAVDAFTAEASNLGRWFLGAYAVSHTSGSQGPSLPIVQERETLRLLFAMLSARGSARGPSGIVEGARRLIEPARIAVVMLRRGFYPSASAFEFMEAMTSPFTRIRHFDSGDPDLVDRLNGYRPHSIVGYASVLEGLALRADDFRLESLRQVANSSEQLTARARARIERAFGVPVMDHYGLGECLFLSDGCPTDGGAHVNADWAILENVDADNRPVPPGVAGDRVLVTNLANRVQPFIRYVVHDRVVMAEGPCRCGSRLPRIARVEGRSAEALWFPDAGGRLRPVPGVVFHDVIDRLPNVREWRAIQAAADEVMLQVECLEGTDHGIDVALIRRRLLDAGAGPATRVRIDVVTDLRPDPRTGKYRRIESRVAPERRPVDAIPR